MKFKLSGYASQHPVPNLEPIVPVLYSCLLSGSVALVRSHARLKSDTEWKVLHEPLQSTVRAALDL